MERFTPRPAAAAEGAPSAATAVAPTSSEATPVSAEAARATWPPRGRVSKFVTPEVIFGIGTLAEVGSAVRRVGGRRPMLVSDPGVLAAGWVERAEPYLADVRVQWRLWHDLTPNPKDVEVQAAFESYLESGCDSPRRWRSSAATAVRSSTTRASTEPPARSRRW